MSERENDRLRERDAGGGRVDVFVDVLVDMKRKEIMT